MACYHPLRAWKDASGVQVLPGDAPLYNLTLPCGRCIGCRLAKSQQWAIRCMHEAKQHRHNAFLTLTYADEHLPQRYWTGKYRPDDPTAKVYGGNLVYRDIQLMFKRMRKALGKEVFTTANWKPLTPEGRAVMGDSPIPPAIKYYLAGEYGAKYDRPHWHICLFGYDFPDKKYFRKSPTGKPMWLSQQLQELWPYGYSSIGEVNYESAAYVARYVMKKQTGTLATTHYERIDQDTGEIIKLEPEFNEMSRKEGIGKNWLLQYTADVYTTDKVIVRGRELKPPRYYDKLYKSLNPEHWEVIHAERQTQHAKHKHDSTPNRLSAREAVATAKATYLKRKIS